MCLCFVIKITLHSLPWLGLGQRRWETWGRGVEFPPNPFCVLYRWRRTKAVQKSELEVVLLFCFEAGMTGEWGPFCGAWLTALYIQEKHSAPRGDGCLDMGHTQTSLSRKEESNTLGHLCWCEFTRWRTITFLWTAHKRDKQTTALVSSHTAAFCVETIVPACVGVLIQTYSTLVGEAIEQIPC